MGSNFYPATSSPIKSIQRGSAASAGTVTISSVDTSKTFVRSFSNGSTGSVGINASESGTLTPASYNVSGGGGNLTGGGNWGTYSGTRSFSGGSTSLTVAKYGAYLTNSTTLTLDGACYYEVVEYN
jgi:hypothetical protein